LGWGGARGPPHGLGGDGKPQGEKSLAERLYPNG
jgi:hypothetical protein